MTDKHTLVERIAANLRSASRGDRMYERPMSWEDADLLLARITALEAEKAELVAATEGLLALVDDMSRFVGQMSLRDYALFNAAPIHARATLAKARQTEGEGNE